MREFGHSVSTFKLLTDRFKLTCSSYCLQLITVSIQAEKEHSVLSNLFFLTLPNEVILNFSTSFCFFYLFMFSSFFSKHACVLSRFSRIQLFATLWTMLSMEFATRLLCPWQEYWSGLPCPPPVVSSWSRDQTHISYVSCIIRWVLYHKGHFISPNVAIAVLNSVAGCAALVNNFLFHCPFHIFFAFRQDLSSSKFFTWWIGSN